jgi:hypothetical protein
VSKSIRSFEPSKRLSVIQHRLQQKTKGLGYWGAMDASEKMKQKPKQ